jgi:SulP family sulfate permease
MVAVISAWRAGLFAKKHWANNLLAGVIVGVIALPLGMAFAIASGLKPEQGLYTAIVAGLLVSLFGGTRTQIAGPTGAFIVIVLGIVNQFGVVGLQVATVMAGVMLVIMGLVRFGDLIKFIPDPVIVGFTSGIALLIGVGQLPPFLGVSIATTQHFHHKLMYLAAALPLWHWPTTLLGLFSLATLLFAPKLPWVKKVPGPVWVLVMATLTQSLFNFEGVATIGSTFGGIPLGLPSFAPLPFHFSQVMLLIGPAFTIAMLGAIESLLSAVVADGMSNTRHNPNQELIGQGLANIVAPFFGGFAATGAIARTATSIRSGATSPLAGVVHAITLILVLLLLAPLASNIPLSALAAILFIVAYNMSEASHFIHIVKFAPKADVAILLTTFLLTLFTDLVVAVNIGIIMAMFHFLGRMAASAEVRTVNGQALAQKLTQYPTDPLPDNLLVYTVEGPFFFGAAEKFQSTLSATHTDPAVVLIRLSHVPFIDMTGLEAFEDAILSLQKRKVRVLVSEANLRVYKVLERTGVLAKLGEAGYFETLGQALQYVSKTNP